LPVEAADVHERLNACFAETDCQLHAFVRRQRLETFQAESINCTSAPAAHYRSIRRASVASRAVRELVRSARAVFPGKPEAARSGAA
jgi:hypothetical protein